METKKFSVTFVMTVDKSNNILSSYPAYYTDDIRDLIERLLYDVDDVKISNLNVRDQG